VTDIDSDVVQAELERAVAAQQEALQLDRRIAATGRDVEGWHDRIDRLRTKLDGEAADVERLESLSPAKIWSVLKGSHASDLERESAERDAARFALAEAESRREVAQRELDSLRAQREALGDVDATLGRAMEAKEAWIAAQGGTAARELADIAERKGELTALDAEAREAHTAGVHVVHLLDEALGLLGSAGSWATWDTFGGGGLITDMVKHDKMDRATALLRQADQALHVFSRELADVNMHGVEGLRVEGLSRTFDIWFDNIFSDMAARSRIQDAGNRVTHTRQQVAVALAGLEEKGRTHQAEMATLSARREELLR
jgi:hypothetical protein